MGILFFQKRKKCNLSCIGRFKSLKLVRLMPSCSLLAAGEITRLQAGKQKLKSIIFITTQLAQLLYHSVYLLKKLQGHITHKIKIPIAFFVLLDSRYSKGGFFVVIKNYLHLHYYLGGTILFLSLYSCNYVTKAGFIMNARPKIITYFY